MYNHDQESHSTETKDKMIQIYLYSSSSINVPGKFMSAGEIDPGLDETLFLTVGDISGVWIAFGPAAMSCFLLNLP